jgi:hypothetical protein
MIQYLLVISYASYFEQAHLVPIDTHGLVVVLTSNGGICHSSIRKQAILQMKLKV